MRAPSFFTQRCNNHQADLQFFQMPVVVFLLHRHTFVNYVQMLTSVRDATTGAPHAENYQSVHC